MGKEKIKSAIVCEAGCSEFAAKELEKKYGIKDCTLSESYVMFDADLDTLVKITYSSQSAKRVLIVIANGIIDKKIEELEKDISEKVTQQQLNDLLNNQSFRINCERTGEHDFTSVDAEQTTGIELEKKVEGKEPVNLKNPDIYLYMNIQGKEYILGIDLAGRDLSKREYRLFSHPGSIKGTLAFALLMFSGYDKKNIIVDAFSLSGEIPIEAALFESNTPVNFYDKTMALEKAKLFSNIDVKKIIGDMDKKITKAKGNSLIKSFDVSFRNISAQKKNAKIAGVEKHISFSRTDSHSVDLKLNEKIDILCSKIIEPSKNINEKSVVRIYEEFFRNISAALKKKAVVTFIVRDPKLLLEESEKQGFKLVNKRTVFQGKQKFLFVKLSYGG